ICLHCPPSISFGHLPHRCASLVLFHITSILTPSVPFQSFLSATFHPGRRQQGLMECGSILRRNKSYLLTDHPARKNRRGPFSHHSYQLHPPLAPFPAIPLHLRQTCAPYPESLWRAPAVHGEPRIQTSSSHKRPRQTPY